MEILGNTNTYKYTTHIEYILKNKLVSTSSFFSIRNLQTQSKENPTMKKLIHGLIHYTVLLLSTATFLGKNFLGSFSIGLMDSWSMDHICSSLIRKIRKIIHCRSNTVLQ